MPAPAAGSARTASVPTAAAAPAAMSGRDPGRGAEPCSNRPGNAARRRGAAGDVSTRALLQAVGRRSREPRRPARASQAVCPRRGQELAGGHRPGCRRGRSASTRRTPAAYVLRGYLPGRRSGDAQRRPSPTPARRFASSRSRRRLPTTAGAVAPPEPLGDGHPGLVPALAAERSRAAAGAQAPGSGWPKTDSVIVSRIPSSTRGAAGAAPYDGSYVGPVVAIGADIASGVVALSTMSAELAAGVAAGGNGGNGFCAWA